MRAVTQMGKETAMTTAGREMKIRQLSVSRPTCTCCMHAVCMPAQSVELIAFRYPTQP